MGIKYCMQQVHMLVAAPRCPAVEFCEVWPHRIHGTCVPYTPRYWQQPRTGLERIAWALKSWLLQCRRSFYVCRRTAASPLGLSWPGRAGARCTVCTGHLRRSCVSFRLRHALCMCIADVWSRSVRRSCGYGNMHMRVMGRHAGRECSVHGHASLGQP